jgi:toxin ParE1/3/4
VRVDYRPEALSDLESIYDWIAEQSGHERAGAYVDQIIDFCDGLDLFPERGKPHLEIGLDVRSLSFRRSIVVSYVIGVESVVVLRVYGKGRNIVSG